MAFLLIGSLLGGCGRTKPAADARVPPPADATVTAALPPIPLVRSSKDGGEAGHIDWVKDFDRQKGTGDPAATLSKAALALVPPGEAKIVAWGVKRHMALTRPRPGSHSDMIRIVTPARGKTLRAAIARHLKRLGYPVIDPQLRSPMRHPEHGVLSLKFTEKPDLAARVEFTLQRTGLPDLAFAEAIAALNPVFTWPAAPHSPLGYELEHFHAVRFPGAFTDVRRIAFAIRVNDVAQAQGKLIGRIKGEGFYPASQEAELYRTDTGSLFTTRAGDEPGVLVLHWSERWPTKARQAKPARP